MTVSLHHHEVAVALDDVKFDVDVLGGLYALNSRAFDNREVAVDEDVVSCEAVGSNSERSCALSVSLSFIAFS